MVTSCLEHLQALFYHPTEKKEAEGLYFYSFGGVYKKKSFSRSPTRLALHFIGQKYVTQLSLVAKKANYSLSCFKNWLGNLLMGQ